MPFVLRGLSLSLSLFGTDLNYDALSYVRRKLREADTSERENHFEWRKETAKWGRNQKDQKLSICSNLFVSLIYLS